MLVAVVASRSRFDVIFMFFSLRSGIVVELLTRSSRAYASLWGYSGDGEDFGGIFRSIGPTEWCRFVVVARSAHVASRRRQPRRHSARPFVPRDDRRWFVAGLSREQFPDFYVRRPEDGARRLRVPDDRKLSRYRVSARARRVPVSRIHSRSREWRLGFISRRFLNRRTCSHVSFLRRWDHVGEKCC